MREIKFRGKRVDTGEWVYGVPVFYGDGVFISSGELLSNHGVDWRMKAFEVDPKTVGQYTGRKNKNGGEICEGDVLKNIYIEKYTDENIVNLVESKRADGHFDNYDEYFEALQGAEKEREVVRICPVLFEKGHFYCRREQNQWLFLDNSEKRFETIGNIHDNPELMEAGA